ncbi:hypothetical protein Elgi_38790 [Paenibacillus elgii]|uniref:hypothetical protein n=1 Tax=Paenibacillus elgii TaxID=189691 RepID=UPI002D7AFA4F|nr:hypothetical protein Elgi_38790 [Paenibacillus elgii]
MNEMVSKWMYNAGQDNESWRCDEGEFDTKEEAIEAGRKYFTEPDGYKDYEGEKYEGTSFNVGQIFYPDYYIDAWHAIESAQEQAYDQCGHWAESWLEKVKNEDEKMLSNMLTETFKEWLKNTNNEPHFFTIKNVEAVELDSNKN